MRTILLGNGDLACRIGQYLDEHEELAGVVLHPEDKRKGAIHILSGFDVPVWTWPDGYKDIRALEPTCLLSVKFGYILSKEWLAIPSWQPVNLHPGLLPWNRGADPTVWPLIDGSPAGTTLHIMYPKVDTGPMLVQQQVPIYTWDNRDSLWARVEQVSFQMFKTFWPIIKDICPREYGWPGTYHAVADRTW